MSDYDDIFSRHDRVAIQVSGGKDSLAALYLLRPYWDRLVVYWLNPGNPFPETYEVIDRVASMVPHFKEVRGRQREIIKEGGWPSDVVPIRWTSFGQFGLGEKAFKVQGRFDCCWRSLMLPMHEAMLEDGITCVIRGKRSDEVDKSPSRSGDVIDGIEFVYPLWDWSAGDVHTFLRDNGVQLPDYYLYVDSSLDCMDCTAWWEDGIGKFTKARYPALHAEYVRRIGLIKSAIADELTRIED
jgi:phosphoadenosine phosphosulfate reductase